MSKELTLAGIKPGLLIEKVGSRLVLCFETEDEAEALYIALVEADRKGSFVKLDFGKGGVEECRS